MSLRAFGFLLGDGTSGGGTFDTDIDRVLSGPSTDLWHDDTISLEVLLDQNGNILLGI